MSAVTLDQIGELVKDVGKRLDAQPEPLSREAINKIVNDLLDQRINDPDDEVFRKMRFPEKTVDPKLVGSKFARHGLSRGDIEFLHDLQLSSLNQPKMGPGGSVGRGPSEELENAFNAMTDAYYMPEKEVAEIDGKALDDLVARLPSHMLPKERDRQLHEAGLWWMTDSYHQALAASEATRAMDSAETGFGLQLIGAQYVTDLWAGARSLSKIFARLQAVEMVHPTMYIPVEADIPEMLFVSESTSANATAYTTVKTGSNRVQLDAKKFVFHQQWSGEMGEDSIIPFVAYLRRQQAVALAHYMDSLVLNGDDTNAATGNINLDDADPADTKHYLAFDGIRHVGLVDVTTNQKDLAGAAITWNALRRVPGRMLDTTYLHDWGHPINPNDLIYVADPETADEIALLDEVKGLDRIGSATPLLTGQLARIGPHPLIPSIACSKTEADGKVSTTATNNTLGQVVPFNPNAFKFGWRRRVMVETDRDIKADQNIIVVSLRGGFGRFSPTGAASGIEGADVLFNILLG